MRCLIIKLCPKEISKENQVISNNTNRDQLKKELKSLSKPKMKPYPKGNFKDHRAIWMTTIRRMHRDHKNTFNHKTKLFQKEGSKEDPIILTLLQGKLLKNQSNLDLKNNGKWKDNFKVIQVIRMTIKCLKMQRDPKKFKCLKTNSCQKEGSKQWPVINKIICRITQSDRDKFDLKAS